MITLSFKNSLMAMIIALLVVSCESKSSDKQKSVADAENSLNNLDFEIEENGLPSHWYAGNGGNLNGNFKVKLDNLEKHSGKLSLKMEMLGDREVGNSGLFTGTLPIELVAGKTVEFKAWIKTKEIENGYAGLWLRIDGENKNVLGFDNMSDRGLNGTNDWTQVSIKMDVSKDVTNINFGGLFQGEGTAWFDNLELFIDGEKYKNK